MKIALVGLRHMIASGELAPGQKFPTEPELCERLGVSRTALREAVRTLAALGVIQSRHGSGTYVSQLDPADIVRNFSLTVDLLPLKGLLQLLEIRRVLEAHASSLAAARCTPELADQLTTLIVQMEYEPDDERAADLDKEFHRLICDMAGNATIASLMDVFRSRSRHYNIFAHVANARAISNAGHRGIVEAITSHDPAAASAAAASHVAQTERWLHLLQAAQVEPVSENVFLEA